MKVMEKHILKINYYSRESKISIDEDARLQIFLMTYEKINKITEKEINLFPESILLIDMLFQLFNKEKINNSVRIQNKKFIKFILNNNFMIDSLLISNFIFFYTLKKIVKQMIKIHNEENTQQVDKEYTDLLEKIK
jgi:hypothetical protein